VVFVICRKGTLMIADRPGLLGAAKVAGIVNPVVFASHKRLEWLT
jgi:hypothetical protein